MIQKIYLSFLINKYYYIHKVRNNNVWIKDLLRLSNGLYCFEWNNEINCNLRFIVHARSLCCIETKIATILFNGSPLNVLCLPFLLRWVFRKRGQKAVNLYKSTPLICPYTLSTVAQQILQLGFLWTKIDWWKTVHSAIKLVCYKYTANSQVVSPREQQSQRETGACWSQYCAFCL